MFGQGVPIQQPLECISDKVYEIVIARRAFEAERRKLDEAISSLKVRDCFVEPNSLRSFGSPRNDGIIKLIRYFLNLRPRLPYLLEDLLDVRHFLLGVVQIKE